MQLTSSQRAAFNSAVANRAFMKRTGETHAGHRLWTADEDAIVRNNWPDACRCQKLLRNRTHHAIAHRARHLGLCKSRVVWQRGQEPQLHRRYPTNEAVAVIAADLSKTPKQVWNKASSRRLRRPKQRPLPANDPLVDDIRQRAFALNISLKDLDEAVGRGSRFKDRRFPRNWRCISRAIRVLGGTLEASI